MNFMQFALILWARRRILLLTLGGTFLTTLGVSLVLPKTYTASVSVVVDYKGTDPLTGVMLPAQLMPGYMATQVDIISSHSVALRVVDRLKLADVPLVREQFVDATDGQGSIRDWLADSLLEDLDVKPSRESSVINIEFGGADPQFAAELANGFAESYIQASLELKVDPARRQAGWFDEQIKGLRETLEKAQQRLSALQRESGIVAADDRLDLENARLAEISSQLVAAQAQTYDSESRLRQMNEASDKKRLHELPDILGNNLLQSMKADLGRAEGKLAETAERYGSNHPQYQSAAAEVATLRGKITAEINTAKGSIEQSADLTRQREQDLQQALDEQKSRILELKRQRDQVAVLTREVESAQRAYETAMQRASQVRLESQIDQSNIAILNPAIPPLKPSKPKILLNLILSIFLGTMLGVGFALMTELLDRRVRSGADLVEGLGLPVLAEMPSAQTERIRHPILGRLFGRLAAVISTG